VSDVSDELYVTKYLAQYGAKPANVKMKSTTTVSITTHDLGALFAARRLVAKFRADLDALNADTTTESDVVADKRALLHACDGAE
jgi:hypothetical protein